MVFSFRELFFGGKTFCCCLPVRSGVLIMSTLGILIGGLASVVLWYEVASSPGLSSGERVFFVLAALLETFLFIASILGFVGAIVRKQLFVQIYAYFIYVHLVLNIGIAGYLLYEVSDLTDTAADVACQKTIQNVDAQEQCTGLLKVARGVYYVVAIAVLLIEAYGVIIVTRYVNQVKGEKRTAKATMQGYDMSNMNTKYARLGNERSPSDAVPLKSYNNPYGDDDRNGYTPSRTSFAQSVRSYNPYDDIHDTAAANSDDVEKGYQSGAWTPSVPRTRRDSHSLSGSDEEDDPARFKRSTSLYDDPYADSHSESKSGKTVDSLPRYTLSDSGPTKPPT